MMDTQEFIRLYVNASDDVKARVNELLENSKEQSEDSEEL